MHEGRRGHRRDRAEYKRDEKQSLAPLLMTGAVLLAAIAVSGTVANVPVAAMVGAVAVAVEVSRVAVAVEAAGVAVAVADPDISVAVSIAVAGSHQHHDGE